MITSNPQKGQALVKVVAVLDGPQYLIPPRGGQNGKVYAHATGEHHIVDKQLLKELGKKVEVIRDGDEAERPAHPPKAEPKKEDN